MFFSDSLIQLLSGDLARVVARHVRMNVSQNNRFGITAILLQKLEYISRANDATISYTQKKFRKDEKLFRFRIIAGIVAVEFVRPLVPFHSLQSLSLKRKIS